MGVPPTGRAVREIDPDNPPRDTGRAGPALFFDGLKRFA